MNRPNSTAENVPKIEEFKLSSCGLEVADFRRNCNCGIPAAEQHFFQSCGIAIAEVLPSNCGIAIANSKKSCACPPLPPVYGQDQSILLLSMGKKVCGFDKSIFLLSMDRNCNFLPVPETWQMYSPRLMTSTLYSSLVYGQDNSISPYTRQDRSILLLSTVTV
jgi:hypothetical protein